MKRSGVLALLLFVAACGGEDEPLRKKAPAPDAATPITVVDAAPLPLPTFDPQRSDAAGRTIEIVLESSPPGANVAVDGLSLGSTPVIWRGIADGRAHDFSFEKKDHENQNYRFIPIQNGVVHGTLLPSTTKASLPPPR